MMRQELLTYNNTDLIDNEMNNINRINPSSEERKRQADRMDGIDIINAYTDFPDTTGCIKRRTILGGWGNNVSSGMFLLCMA